MLVTGPITVKPPEDPLEAYLREKRPFDMDAYLHEKRIEAMSKNVSGGESFARGAGQGATLGFNDEIQGAVQAAGGRVLPESMGGFGPEHKASFGQDYKQNRDTARDENAAASMANPKTYLAGDVVGSAPLSIASGAAAGAAAKGAGVGAKILPRAIAAGQGMIQGAGYSNADTAGGVAGDSLLGGALGVGGNEISAGISKAGAKVAGMARGRLAKLAGRTVQQATEEETGKVGSLVGKYGGLRQTENKAIINMLEREKSGLLDQSNLSKLQALKQSGRVTQAINETAANDLEFLSTRTPEVMAAKQEMQAAQQALPQSIAARAAELQKPQFGKDAASFAKSYAEPAVAAALAPVGLKTAAAVLFGRTRAMKALMSRVTRPGNQMAVMRALESGANAPNTDVGTFLRETLARLGPAAATPAFVTQ